MAVQVVQERLAYLVELAREDQMASLENLVSQDYLASRV